MSGLASRIVNSLPRGFQRLLPEYRAIIFKMLGEATSGAEIGVWRGDFAARILSLANPDRLYLIDPWKFEASSDYSDSWYGLNGAGSQEAMDAIYCSVVDRFASETKSERVCLLRLDSVDAAASFNDGELDWVYIDGDHTHEHVLADLRAYLPKVKVGGLLCGDDYGQEGWWNDGVTTAVMEFVRESPVRVEAVHNAQFVLRRLP